MPGQKIDNGMLPNTTQIPNIILDKWMPHLSPAEFKVLMYICRRTYGFNKPQDKISVKQITDGIRKKNGEVLDAGTGLSRSTVIVCVHALEKKGVLLREHNKKKSGADAPTSYSLDLARLPRGQGGERGSDPRTQGVQQPDPQNPVLQQSTVVEDSAYATSSTTGRDEPDHEETALQQATDGTAKKAADYVACFAELLSASGLAMDATEGKICGAQFRRLLLQLHCDHKTMMTVLGRMWQRWNQGQRIHPLKAHGDVTGVPYEAQGKGGASRRGSPEEVIAALENYENKGKTDLQRFAALARSYDFTLSESPPYGVIKALGGTETEANQNLTRIRSVANKALKASRSIESSNTQTTP